MRTNSLIIKGINSSLSNRTGQWSSRQAEIDPKKCIKCHQCFLYCPEGCVEILEDGKNVRVNKDYCKGCGVCAVECSVKAIKIISNL
ncbi:MAG: pyruvate synthase [Candidatus Moranbacteria bacterium]|nr:pyruvate synthase [Candidatus Moranbacteria bacterium]